MDRLRRDVILVRLIEALHKHGSWCGETHVQKATYFLQEMLRARLSFDFILYKHGPFSFDLSDELAAMRADGYVSLRVRDPNYGPSIVAEPAAGLLSKRFPKTLREHESRVEFIAERIGNKPVTELERLATSLYVIVADETVTNPNVLAQRVYELKPHVSVEQALEGVRTVGDWRREAAEMMTG